jgi:sulfur-oxidizing protein SoxA
MGPDGDQAGSVGPNLSAYGNSNRDSAWTFQQIWDARAHNPETLMPPFGTNGLLTEAEVADIAAYLQTLKQALAPPARPPLRTPRERIYVSDEDFSMADSYVEAGKALFEKAGHNGRSCADCHGTGKEGPALSKAAARYPKYNEAQGRMVNLEQRINMCRAKYMDSRHFHLGSRPSNVLTSYVKYLARNAPIEVATSGAAADAAKRGGELFSRRSGQLNLSCASCHVDAAGQWLRGQHLDRLDDVAGQWPKHYIALHDLGLISLQQRIRHCQIVTRSYPLALGSKEYTDLETYLTSLSNGTPVLAPTMSRMRGE